ncbi:MAG: diguanylate cyclase [Gammaproteobacteria bacterium]|nr:diguanylate cyclase [Gammaproteobacteria bacterium]
MLRLQDSERDSRQDAATELAGLLIEQLEREGAPDPTRKMHLKLIRMRLSGSPSSQELASLLAQCRQLAATAQVAPNGDAAAPDTPPKISPLEQSLNNLISELESATRSRPVTEEAAPQASPIADDQADTDTDTDADTNVAVLSRADTEKWTEPMPRGKRGEDRAKVWSSKNNGGRSSPFRLHTLQKTLERQLSEVIDQNEKFGRLLEVEHTTLKRLNNVTDLEALKQIMINEIGRLMNGHDLLQRKLEDTRKYVSILESEGEEINSELARAHNLSLTDELTRLPNRRAFIRQLEDEVARVQRYGYPLTMALLDLDHFKVLNDRYGHPMGDEALRKFSACVTSAFRHHDMVARYGGEEFAIVLPNTNIEGAQRALEKVRGLTRSTRCKNDNQEIPLPTFSGGVALYKPGETTGSLIERADKALYRAKREGRNRIETDDIETISLPKGNEKINL